MLSRILALEFDLYIQRDIAYKVFHFFLKDELDALKVCEHFGELSKDDVAKNSPYFGSSSTYASSVI
ncbi:2043_t:CDS:2 [Funneliformis caledonium]|uniref:2043_t:CDS:1 n=1 Tax=Funneliformis caledonium TaxID=1117310 RepID=A0A9N8V5U4_9GLOM|nr:2043_t:CDS:2 [Funneliformis caledonium]